MKPEQARTETGQAKPASIDKKAFSAAIDVLAGEFPPESGITIEVLRRLCTAYEAAKQHPPSPDKTAETGLVKELAAFVATIARMKHDGEEVEGREFVMENDDAVTTLNELIDTARELTNAQPKAEGAV